MLVLLGPNGAGKTSTVETLEGYRRAAGGTVRVLGLDPGATTPRWCPRIGVMLQRGGVYPMLGPAPGARPLRRLLPEPEDPDELLDLVGLRAVAATPWRRLSGGEQQRLSLALALVGRPEVALPRRADRRRRPRGPPRRPRGRGRPAASGASAWC